MSANSLFFSDSQIDQIREGAMDILAEIGVKLGRSELITQLKEKGFLVAGDFVRIDKTLSRKKIEERKEITPTIQSKQQIKTYISPYSHIYETLSGTFEGITAESNAKMAQFAANVAKIWPSLSISPPGHPRDLPPELQFFRQTINGYIWCEGFSPLEPTSIKVAPYYFELREAMGKPVTDLPIYVASPLNVSGESFDISLAYAHKINEVHVGSMPSLGANTPLNLVAAYSQTLAEVVGGAVVFEALTGVRAYYNTRILPFDFYDMTMPFGSPEMMFLECANTEVSARVSGGAYFGPSAADIHVMAPRSGVQASAEKAALAAAGAMLGASHMYCSGTVAMDEVFSPVQLLLDLEMLEHVQKMVDGLPNDKFEGDLIEEVREGMKQGYLMSDRTLDNMRDYMWRPNFFTRKTFGAYSEKAYPLEIEKAMEKAHELMAMPPSWKISNEAEAEAEKIFKLAYEHITKR